MFRPGEMTSRIASRFAEVRASTTGIRSDLRVTDSVEIEAGSTYRIVLSYDRSFPAPTLREVKQYVQSISGDALVPNMATARVHNEGRHHGVSLVVAARKITRPYADRTSMIPVVANTMFMDTVMKDNWSVARREDGVQVLECNRDENIGRILANAIHASVNHPGLVFGDETVGGACCAETGDVVQFYAENAQRQGTVMSVKGEDVRIAEQDGNTFIVPLASVISIVTKNPKSAQEAVNEDANFYATFLGKDFAKAMFPNAKI